MAKNPIAESLLNLKPEDGLQWSRHITISKGPTGVTEKTIEVQTKKIFKDGKWLEETLRTQTITNENGTKTTSKKKTLKDLPFDEIPRHLQDISDESQSPEVFLPASAPLRPVTNKGTKKPNRKTTRAPQPIVKDDPEAFIKQVLASTNNYRKTHGAQPLQLSEKLNKLAKDWAEKLAKMERMEHGDIKNIGENIYCKTSSQPWFQMSGEEVVENWYSEVEDHNYNEEPKQGFLKSGHFTQLVWKDTKEMGVAFARNKNGHMAFVVAYFSPKGNWIGEFKEKVLPPGGVQRTKESKTAKITRKPSNRQIDSVNSTATTRNRTKVTTSPESLLGSGKSQKSNKTTPNSNVTTASENYRTRSVVERSVYRSSNKAYTPPNVSGKSSNTSENLREKIDSPTSPESRSYSETPKSRIYSETPKSRSYSETSKTYTPPNSRGKSSRNSEKLIEGFDSPTSPDSRSHSETPNSQKSRNIISPLKYGSRDFPDESPGSPIYQPLEPSLTMGSVAEDEFYEDCLNAHNYYREMHGVQPLRLSETLTEYAQAWADALADKDEMEHRIDSEFGENIYNKWSSDPEYKIPGEEAVDSWYEEIIDYEFGKEPLDLSAGHFTQVIWSDSEELGVGISKSKSNNYYVVANYDPPGNYIGQFSKNVPPPL